MNQKHYIKEWQESAIAQSLIDLNLKGLGESAIAEWYFGNLPPTARRNDGRIRDGYLRTYREPLKGGWGIEGYDPTDLNAEPELRTFKPDFPRLAKDGKIIKYDTPKNAKHYPILPRISYKIAAQVFLCAGLNYLELTRKYAPEEITTGVDENAECPWFWQAVLDNARIPLSVAEGGKKALSLLSQGRCAIAVTSITTWRAEGGSDKLHPWLAMFAPNRNIYLTFDRDIKPNTVKAVNVQSWKLGRGFARSGATRIKRLIWGGTTKGIDDFIYNLKSKYGDRYMQGVLSKCYTNSRDYRKFNEQKLPGRIEEVNKRYLKHEDVARKCKILIVKSAKGTNKTGVLAELARIDRESGIATLNLSHLERLARELGIRLDLPYRTEAGTTSVRADRGYSLCIDSFSPKNSIPFLPEQWTGAGLAIDEFTQVLHHLAFGSTEVGRFRKLILATLGQKLADCWEHDRPIRLLDADADAETVELVYELIQTYAIEPPTREELEAETLAVVNNYEPEKGKLYFYHEPSPRQIKADLIEMMRADKNILILTSSQQVTSADGSINLEELAKKHYLPREILRIDSTTVGDPSHPAFNITGESLVQLIANTDVKIVIASPIICTGISIEQLNCFFQGVFSFQSGNISPNSVRQQLVRLRDFDAPRYVWCPKVGMSFVGSKSTNPVELLADQKGETKLALSLLSIPEAENLLRNNTCPLTKYWARIGAKNNRNSYFYREKLYLDLEAEGWQIHDIFPPDNNEELEAIWQERKAIKAASIESENHAISEAHDLSYAEAQRLETRKDLNQQEQQQLQKHQIIQKYHISEITPELVAVNRKKFYYHLQLRFWLTVGREYLEQRDRASLAQVQENNRGDFFIPDFNNKNYIVKVKLLEMLSLARFLEPGTEWSNKSVELIRLRDFVLKDLIRLNQILGCGIAVTDSPITILQKILKQIGYRLPYYRNERDGKKRLRIYGSAQSRYDLADLEENILESWLALSAQKFLEEEEIAA